MPPAPNPPIVCYVTDRKAHGLADPTGSVLAKIRAVIAAGADLVQIREKDLAARELLALARNAVATWQTLAGEARTGKVRPVAGVVVNDRLDVALAAGAAGVHLGRESAPVREVVRWCRKRNAPAEFLAGVSCHSLEEAREAESAGASYVFFGPVFDTPSKRNFGPPQGIARLGEVCRAVEVRVIAIGGVNEENGAECIRAGAAGIAAIRLFQQPSKAGALKDAIARLHRASRQS